MKKEVMREISICDNCGKEGGLYTCMSCKREFCWDCVDKGLAGKKFSHAIYVSGSGDGFFCNECLQNPDMINPSVKKLLKSYRVVENLKFEYIGWQNDFEKRRKEAEEKVQQCLKAAGS